MGAPELGSLSVEYLEQLYEQFSRDPADVPDQWREYFEGLAEGNGAVAEVSRRPAAVAGAGPDGGWQTAQLQESVDLLIRNYRVRGHLIAKVNPLGTPPPYQPELDLHYYGFSEADFDRKFSTTHLPGSNTKTLGEIVQLLQETYCGYISVQYMHIDEPRVREWLQRRMEDPEQRLRLTRQQQLRVLTRLTDAVIFEEFVRRKYVGAKTFSLEGAESLVPLLDLAIEKAGGQGVKEIVIGMAHRGRLNVLANIIGKSPQDIFREFEDVDPERYRGSGDVKYHLGYRNEYVTSNGQKVQLSLCFNPSHLEFVNPVALGLTRAKQDRSADFDRDRNLAILVHGDAAFSGEGIVQETLNLSQLPGYTVGGTLHIVVNNQIGFTTCPEEGRSTRYATDIARMLQSPIFHVNGEHPEAVLQVIHLAMEFRKHFHRDVVIDMYGYRRWGHNEGDEPAFTQPLLYKNISRLKSVRDAYLEHLLSLGGVTEAEGEQIARRRQEHLEHALTLARREDFVPQPRLLNEDWREYRGGPERPEYEVESGVPEEQICGWLDRLTQLPAGFHIHPKLHRVMEGRRAMAKGERPLDWAAGEALALASLAAQGYRVRVSGQDAERGTFSHRHAVLHDTEDGHTYMPLKHVEPDQAPIQIFNSPLSEAGVLGFEYGFSLGYPDALVIWEAQFGDFANAAQVIIDQFLTSAEDKWGHLSGLVLLLPHGFEGQGPEHSSARLERYLTLAAENNIQVAYPSTPAQIFHLLRRQALRRWQKPLVVMTPKSMLRDPRVVSSLEDCSRGSFQRVIADSRPADRSRVRRVLLCSGKLYYELAGTREERKQDDVAIVRIEQLYPRPMKELADVLEGYPDGTPVFWVQEEPRNMGALAFWKASIGHQLLGRFPMSYISRPASASPASGSASAHKLEQAELIARAFGELDEEIEEAAEHHLRQTKVFTG